MDCKKANDLMMKYMDGNISKDEVFSLKKHIDKCDKCYEDFLIYDKILKGFSSMDNIVTVPEDFEKNVMSEIYALGDVYTNRENRSDALIYAVWGGVSVLCGLGMLLILNKDIIMNYFKSSPKLSAYAEYFEPVENFVVQFKSSAEELINSFMSYLSAYANDLKLVSLAAFIILVLAQIIIYKKDKVEAK